MADGSVIIDGLRALAVPIDTLQLDAENARRGDMPAIRRSLNAFGQRKPVVVKRTGTDAQGRPTGVVIAGNHTMLAALDLGWSELAAVFVDDDTMTARAFALADNRTGELAEWDDAQLAATLRELSGEDFDMTALGWTNEELAALLNGDGSGTAAPLATVLPSDDAPEPPTDPVTKPGDIWELGPHRIICGDCRDHGVVAKLLGDARINVAFTSPPYASQRVYDESSGFRPIPPGDYVEWFEDVQANVRAFLAGDGSWFVNIKPAADGLDTELYVFDLVLAHARRWGWHFATEYVWERNGVPKNVTRRFKNQFEPIYQFVAGDWKMRPDAVRHESQNVPRAGGPGSGDTGWQNAQGGPGSVTSAFGHVKKRTNGTGEFMSDTQGSNSAPGEFIGPGLAYPGNRLPTFAGSHTAHGHAAAFPVGLPAFFLRAYSDPGDTVYDPFMGSGSTIMAAQAEGRIGYGCEISPAYVDVICKRYQAHTGIVPILAATGAAHDFTGDDNGTTGTGT